MKFFFGFILLVVAALVICAKFNISPILPLFAIIGVSLYVLIRTDQPLPESDPRQCPTSGHGIYLERADFIPPDRDNHSGGHFRDGVDPSIPSDRL
jgi:hypothetical protein